LDDAEARSKAKPPKTWHSEVGGVLEDKGVLQPSLSHKLNEAGQQSSDRELKISKNSLFSAPHWPGQYKYNDAFRTKMVG
jgi:hypothetical protein